METSRCGRRTVLKILSSAGATMVLPSALGARVRKLPGPVRFGVITDVHVGFVKGAEDRLAAFLAEMKEVKPDGLIQMGDFAYPNKEHQKYVDQFNGASENAIHAIGNHELDLGLTREDARKSWGIPGFYYRKDIAGVRVIVLDGNDRGALDYNTHGGYHRFIGMKQREWLARELESAHQPVLIVSHQPLAGTAEVDHAEEVREILVPHQDKILLCLNGHSHVDQHLVLDGINYLHVNSASYYWLGGKVSLATYKDPLFTTMTIDPATGTVGFTGSISEWGSGTPEEAGYFENGKNEGLRKIVQPRIGERSLSPEILKSTQ